MNMHRALLTPVALSVLLALAAAPAGAQEAATSDGTSSETTSSETESFDTTTTTTSRFSTSSASLVPIAGIVSGQPESVAFSGQAQIRSVLVRDPDFNRPSLLLTFDLSSVSGVGSSTTAQYVIRLRELVQRRVAASQVLEVTFPFIMKGATDLTSARAGVASFALDFNVDTGVITSATGRIASPNF